MGLTVGEKNKMKPGDLVKYARWHKSLRHLAGIVIEIQPAAAIYEHTVGAERAYVLWSGTRGDMMLNPLWDSTEELEVINKSHNEEDEKPTAYAHTKENCVVYQEGGPLCPDCVETKGNHLEPSGVSLSQDGEKE